jgi:hypothetical protein
MRLNELTTYEELCQYVKENNDILSYTEFTHSQNNPADELYWNSGCLYGITDPIIVNVGRFCERYQSDALVTINSLQQALKQKNPEETVFIFAIRELGVDGSGYLLDRIKNNDKIISSGYYRKILAVQLETKENSILITLKKLN